MTNKLEKVTELLSPEIDKKLRQVVSQVNDSEHKELYRMLAYQMGWEGEGAGSDARGKRIRPLLVLLTTASAGGNWQNALPAAAAIELIHNFTLIHDDIEDNSEYRRGRPTVWKKWGIPQAINSGDTMFTLANLVILEIDEGQSHTSLKASKILQQTCLRLTQGQFLDLSYENRSSITADDYWSMIGGKTAALIGASAELGALIAGVDELKREHYKNFGISLGLAFQIQDDLLGIWGDEEITGKSTESDLVAGKKSLPVIFGLNNQAEFSSHWTKGPIKPEEVLEIAKLLEDEGAREYTQDFVNLYTQKALTSIHNAKPEGIFGEALIELAYQLLHREK